MKRLDVEPAEDAVLKSIKEDSTGEKRSFKEFAVGMRSIFLFIKRIVAIAISGVLKVVFLPFPMKKNQIIFDSFVGRQYSCNPRAIYEYLLQNYGDELEFVWAFKEPEKFDFLCDNKNTKVCRQGTISHAFAFWKSITAVANSGFSYGMPLRKAQIRINTWHGGGCYKKIATQLEANTVLDKLRYREIDVTNYISSSKYFTEEVVRKQCCFNGQVLETGMPRNDIFFDKEKEAATAESVRNLYGLTSDDCIVLYAPTFRDYNSERESVAYSQIDTDMIADVIKETFYKNVVFMFRGHHAVSSHPSLSCLDVTDYPDMQDLLCAADMLITDYSSSMWDFSFTGKPCFLFVPDLADYLTYRGLDTDIHTWGFPVCETNDELIAAIENFDPEAYAAAMQRHHDTLGSFERGTATKEVAEFIMEHVHRYL